MCVSAVVPEKWFHETVRVRLQSSVKPMLERLQKIIARAGVTSRRHAEELIRSGLVSVNGRVITQLGSKADESHDHIKVSGKLLRSETGRVYLLLHKPTEIVSTMSDPEGRRCLRDLLHGVSQRVFPVGRLDYHASGLLLLTNDGTLANRILQAHHLPQTYHLKLKSLLSFAEIDELARATGGRISRLRVKDTPWYEVTIPEARGDVLRNRLFQTGHPVERMKRVRLANLDLDSLAPGRHRELSAAEIAALSRAIEGTDTAKVRPIRRGPRRRANRRTGRTHRTNGTPSSPKESG